MHNGTRSREGTGDRPMQLPPLLGTPGVPAVGAGNSRQLRLQFHGALKALVGILLKGFGSNFSQGHPVNPELAGINTAFGYNN